MYHKKAFDGHYFIYFWVGRDKVINSDRSGRLFGEPFYVSKDNQVEWRKSSRQNMIAPELLTYWEVEV